MILHCKLINYLPHRNEEDRKFIAECGYKKIMKNEE
jgi:hypothetical protein